MPTKEAFGFIQAGDKTFDSLRKINSKCVKVYTILQLVCVSVCVLHKSIFADELF